MIHFLYWNVTNHIHYTIMQLRSIPNFGICRNLNLENVFFLISFSNNGPLRTKNKKERVEIEVNISHFRRKEIACVYNTNFYLRPV